MKHLAAAILCIAIGVIAAAIGLVITGTELNSLRARVEALEKATVVHQEEPDR